MSKTLTDDGARMLDFLGQNIDTCWDDLTGWQQCFIEDILERYRRYGRKTAISPRAWDRILEINDLAGG